MWESMMGKSIIAVGLQHYVLPIRRKLVTSTSRPFNPVHPFERRAFSNFDVLKTLERRRYVGAWSTHNAIAIANHHIFEGRRSERAQTPVHSVLRACDELALIGRKEKNEPRNVDGFGVATQRDCRSKIYASLFGVVRRERRLERAHHPRICRGRMDRIHPNSVFRGFKGGYLCEANDRML